MSQFLEETESDNKVSVNDDHSLWVEKYRPTKLENYIGNDTLKAKVKQFIDSNQGLKSRFQNYIHFSDYTTDELLHIFENLCRSHQMEIDGSALGDIKRHIEEAKPQGDQGNARYVRNLFEKMYLNMSHRAAEDGNIDLHEIVKFQSADIPSIEIRKQKIGFMPQEKQS